jgi:hypothetical protein
VASDEWREKSISLTAIRDKRRQRNFAGPFHTALSTFVGKRLQRPSALVDGLGYPLSGGRIFLPDVFDNSEKVFNGGG